MRFTPAAPGLDDSGRGAHIGHHGAGKPGKAAPLRPADRSPPPARANRRPRAPGAPGLPASSQLGGHGVPNGLGRERHERIRGASSCRALKMRLRCACRRASASERRVFVTADPVADLVPEEACRLRATSPNAYDSSPSVTCSNVRVRRLNIRASAAVPVIGSPGGSLWHLAEQSVAFRIW